MSDNLSSDDNKYKTRKKLKKIIDIFKDRESNLTNLLMRFILVVILIILVLLSLDIYLYNYQPIVLSKFQYSYYKNNINIPPGLPDSTGTGKNYLLAEELEKCPPGFCAIGKSTGLKRCPNGNYQLIYNNTEEVCTRAEFCDYSELPYAVLSDGTTSLSGKCNTDVPCRCTNQKSCDTGIVSPFEIISGTTHDPNQNSFTIKQNPDTSIQYGYDAIALPFSSRQFCFINTGFSNILTNGCDFRNSVRDKLNCGEGCTSATDGSNFKNMLLCVQEDKQPCLQGTLAYNFDKLDSGNTTTSEIYTSETFSRNFCQQRSNTSDPEIRSNYLEDPAFYTIGCYLGNGCNDKELSLNGETGLKAASGKYFPDVDISGINGTWEVINIGYPRYNPKQNQKSSFIYNSIEPGDFWSIKTESEVLITNKVSKNGTSTVFVTSLLALTGYIEAGKINEKVRPGITINIGSGINDEIYSCNFETIEGVGQFSFNTVSPLTQDIPKNTPVTVNPANFPPGFVSSGIITEITTVIDKNNNPSKKYLFSDENGNTITNTIQNDIFNVVISKQFSFSGLNYNTVVKNNKREHYLSPAELLMETVENYKPEGNDNIGMSGTPLSMYYPVWNPVTFQQECIRCKPNLISYIKLSGDSILRIPIQYSSKDFDNYEFEPQSGGYVFTSVSVIDTDQVFNTTKTFHLTEPNPNLQVGDYIMSMNLQFPVEILNEKGTSSGYKPGSGTSVTIIPQINYGDTNIISSTGKKTKYGIEESVNSNLIYKKGTDSTPGGGTETTIVDNQMLNIEINPSGNGYRIKDLKNSKPDGYCFGKLYRTSKPTSKINILDNDFGFYLNPTVSVSDISSDGKTITTNSPLARDLIVSSEERFSKYLQFCRIGKDLTIDLIQDLGSGRKTIGQNEIVKIDKISGGRITNISVLNGGTEFNQNTVPIVTVGNYDYYVS